MESIFVQEKHYKPEFATKSMAKHKSDREVHVEQHVTGLCSDECWDKYIDEYF